MNQPDSAEIVVELTSHSKTPGTRAGIDAYFRSQTLATVKHEVYLSDTSRTSRVAISRYMPPGEGHNSTLLFFPRLDDAEPHFDGSESKILFHLGIGDSGAVDVFLKPNDMVFNGEFTL